MIHFLITSSKEIISLTLPPEEEKTMKKTHLQSNKKNNTIKTNKTIAIMRDSFLKISIIELKKHTITGCLLKLTEKHQPHLFTNCLLKTLKQTRDFLLASLQSTIETGQGTRLR